MSRTNTSASTTARSNRVIPHVPQQRGDAEERQTA
jgi:hypothetical protein